MKKIILLICFLFLFSTLNCATTKEPLKLATGDFDLTGTWELAEATSGCGTNKKETSTVMITQQGDDVTAVNKDKDWEWTQKVSNGIITIPKSQMDKVALSEYQLMVLEGADALSGTVRWNWDNQCDGKTKLSYTRQ
jgi:hypothetical protein